MRRNNVFMIKQLRLCRQEDKTKLSLLIREKTGENKNQVVSPPDLWSDKIRVVLVPGQLWLVAVWSRDRGRYIS